MILRPDAPAHGGSVVARAGGDVYLVDYALPGEVVEAPPGSRRRGVIFTRATGVVEASPHRVTPRCPHFGSCGGCQLQHAGYSLQLENKRRVVADIWSRHDLRLPPDAAVLGMEDPWRYRLRGEFDAIYSGSDFRLGFHRMRSHTVLPISTCPIHDLRIERALLAFAETARELRVAGLQNLLLTVEPTGPGLLWRARFRGASKAALPDDFAGRFADRLPDLVLLDDSMSLDFWDLSFRVRSDTFIQTNYKQMLVLYATALDMLDAGTEDHVLDLYSGIGTISIAAARGAGSVTAVESNQQAVSLGRLNARINSAANVRFVAGAVEEVLRGIRLGSVTSVILDPPRAGCEPAALSELLRLGPARIVYISCEPSTHARDIAALVRGGYRVRRAAIVDMFPQTYHVESVALLERTAG